MELEKVYTLRQVAQSLSVTTKTVRRMLADGRLQGLKLGNRWRVRVADLDAFLTAAKVKR